MKMLNKWTGLAVVSAVLVAGFFSLFMNVSSLLEKAEAENAITLEKGMSSSELAAYLSGKGFVKDPQDAKCISEWIVSRIGTGGIPNLGALNMERYRMPVSVADSLGGEGLRLRVRESEAILGQTEEVDEIYAGGCPSEIDLSEGQEKSHTMSLKVKRVSERYETLEGRFASIRRKLAKNRKDYWEGVPGVVVRIKVHDSLSVDGRVAGYAMTDLNGEVKVKVCKGGHYSMLPVKPGFEYGASAGTRDDDGITKDMSFERVQKIHTIRPFDSHVYSKMKQSQALLARTPSEYKNALVLYPAIFILAWWLFFLFMSVTDRRRKRNSDSLIPLTLMFLSGVGVLAMFSIADPLTDKMLGPGMVWGTCAGLAAMALVSLVDWERFHSTGLNLFGIHIEFDFVSQFFRWIFPFSRKWNRSLPKGVGYLAVVLLFILLLALFGDGPEGSGTKVNLLFFQPSELNKYLVVIFMAAFFAANAGRIQTFSKRMDGNTWKLQLKTIAFIAVAIVMLLMLYMAVMSDMGPALVLIVTFVMMYSIARRDFGHLIAGVASYVAMLYLAGIVNPGSVGMQVIFSVMWLVLWLAIGWRKERIYESAVFFNLLIAAFVFGGSLLSAIGLESQGQRLMDRNEIAASIWNNDVLGGGDQVVQGIWGLTSGGLFGQGLGQGYPNLIPAFHTDMIFTSIGEEMGWITLVVLLLCMAFLVYRSMVIAYRAGSPFVFFLATGVALVTGVQFFVIILGSIGIIPLTGVAVPFLSYGMTSLIINLAVFGLVIAVSGNQATRNQLEENAKYADVLTYGILSFLCLSLVVIGILFNYQCLSRDRFMVKPAFVADDDGARLAEYNPRIALLLDRLESGNIYDRNGLLLATSSPEELIESKKDFDRAFAGTSGLSYGIDRRIEDEAMKDNDRFYSLGEHMFFTLGDVNTMTLWGIDHENPYGYLAEERHADQLRGFSTAVREDGRVLKDELKAHYKASPFAAPVDTVFRYVKRDYSVLIPMLKDGIDGRLVRKWNEDKHKKDMRLTVDARLQVLLQERMRNDISSSLKDIQKLRASVVVLDASQGDLLCSANYPLPDQDTIRHYLNMKLDYSKAERNVRSKAFTDRDLGLTYQTAPGSTAKIMSALSGFMKMGSDAAEETYYIDSLETVEPWTIEPNYHKDGCNTTMERAVVQSSNCYFIHLVNDNDLYAQLGNLYKEVGVRVGNEDGIYGSYFFDPSEFSEAERFAFDDCVSLQGLASVRSYERYMTENHAAKKYERMNKGDWQWAWGQGSLDASPLNMARVASVVGNGGVLQPTRYVLVENGDDEVDMPDPIRLISKSDAAILKKYMKAESSRHRSNNRPNIPASMGGKTGTPERPHYDEKMRKAGRIINDAWYICFVETETAPLAVAVRLERSVSGSASAVNMVANTIMPALREAGYKVR